MAEGKKKIIVYADWISLFEKLKDEEAGKLIKHFFSYVNDKNPTAEDRLTELLFEPIKATLKRDLELWEAKQIVNKNNGLKGGRPKKETQNNPKKPNGYLKTQNNPKKGVSVSDSVSNNKLLDDYVVNAHDKFSKECLESESWKESVSMKTKVPIDKLQFAMADFLQHLVSIGEEHKRIKDFKYHFTSWLTKRKEIANNQTLKAGKL